MTTKRYQLYDAARNCATVSGEFSTIDAAVTAAREIYSVCPGARLRLGQVNYAGTSSIPPDAELAEFTAELNRRDGH